MPSFEEIMTMPSSEIKAPQPYPPGTYHCIVDGVPEYGKSSQKQTDQFTVKLKILSALQDVDARAVAEQQIIGKTITEIFYITETSAYRFNEFLHDHLGIEGVNLKQMLSEAPGKQVLVKLKHEMSQDGKRIFHRVAETANVGSATE